MGWGGRKDIELPRSTKSSVDNVEPKRVAEKMDIDEPKRLNDRRLSALARKTKSRMDTVEPNRD